MTTAHERTRAVIEARKLLSALASSDDGAVPGHVRILAQRLLRHYPLDVDLSVSTAAVPELWTDPTRRRPKAVSTSQNEKP
ncbi:BPSL0761 family protein [Paraburkholderia hospita]|uniref:BPSL0761 family protein n=1 Tax=Paraburkholderia hospita TaxID=169430 RepID=UPI0009A8ECBA|nr:hypothetical protein SAMN05446934_6470 [Paraburkholderia hospita]